MRCVRNVVEFEREREDAEMAAWLARSRPRPDEEFIDALERRLVGRARVRPRVLALAAGLSGALTCAVLAVALVGGGPTPSDDSRARDCDVVRVPTVATVGELVAGEDGAPRVVTSQQPTSRETPRCR